MLHLSRQILYLTFAGNYKLIFNNQKDVSFVSCPVFVTAIVFFIIHTFTPQSHYSSSGIGREWKPIGLKQITDPNNNEHNVWERKNPRTPPNSSFRDPLYFEKNAGPGLPPEFHSIAFPSSFRSFLSIPRRTSRVLSSVLIKWPQSFLRQQSTNVRPRDNEITLCHSYPRLNTNIRRTRWFALHYVLRAWVLNIRSNRNAYTQWHFDYYSSVSVSAESASDPVTSRSCSSFRRSCLMLVSFDNPTFPKSRWCHS